MLDTLLRRPVPEWATILRALGVLDRGSVLVAGEAAAALGSIVQENGGPPLAYDRPDLALLTAAGPDVPPGFDAATPAATGLPAASVDSVVLRHAWNGVARLGPAVDEAARILRPGGALLLADLDLPELMSANAARYPSQILYASAPDVRAAVNATLAPFDLSVTAGRAGFDGLRGLEVDETAGTFDRMGFVDYVRAGGWRGWELLSPEREAAIVERVERALPLIAPVGPVVDREPWRYVIGVKRG